MAHGRPAGRRHPQRQRAGLDAGGGARRRRRRRAAGRGAPVGHRSGRGLPGLHDNAPTACTSPTSQADYARISEVLSCSAEAVYADGDPGRIAVRAGALRRSAWPTRTRSSARSRPSAGPRSTCRSYRPTTAGLPSVQWIVSVRWTMRQPSARAPQLVLVDAGHDEGVAARRARLDVLADEVAPAFGAVAVDADLVVGHDVLRDVEPAEWLRMRAMMASMPSQCCPPRSPTASGAKTCCRSSNCRCPAPTRRRW